MRINYVLTILSLAVAASALLGETFACNMKALSPEQRQHHQKLSRDLGSAVMARRELPDGYTYQINSAQMPVVDIAEWIALERKCCPFFRFRLDVKGNDDIVGLSLQGAEGVKKFIEMEIHIGN